MDFKISVIVLNLFNYVSFGLTAIAEIVSQEEKSKKKDMNFYSLFQDILVINSLKCRDKIFYECYEEQP